MEEGNFRSKNFTPGVNTLNIRNERERERERERKSLNDTNVFILHRIRVITTCVRMNFLISSVDQFFLSFVIFVQKV